MRSMLRPRLAAGTCLSVFVALAVWSGALTAAPQKASPKKTAPAKSAAAASQMPMLRPLSPGRRVQGEGGQEEFDRRTRFTGQFEESRRRREPREHRMIRARSFNGDLRSLPQTPDEMMIDRPEREGPRPSPSFVGDPAVDPIDAPPPPSPGVIAGAAPAPPPTSAFDGLDFNGFGNGFPPDTNGDVGPEYYIQSINTSLGIFRKATGERVAAFGFNTFMKQGNFGNLCDTNNFGDPVILYDTFEDRWVVTDFAFRLDAAGNVVNPPGAFQCMAVSKTSDPVTGGWNFYSTNFNTGLNDYPKFGVWPDGIYMSANMFGFPAGGGFQGVKVYAFNKAQMYAGEDSMQIVSFDIGGNDFTILPSNARLQAGTPPPGTPNYFVSTWLFLNALTVYKFHVDWDHIGLSTLTGPDVPITPTGWPNAGVANAPSLGGNSLDVLQIRAMMQNQYTNIGGAESLWATHTVRRQNTAGFAAPRWYQLNVTGGAAATAVQAATWDPDGANVMHRFVPSLAVDRAGNMAIGYSTSSATTKPAIKYAGRLATDPINTFSLTEQTMVQGTGTQTGNCGGSVCTRWGDYATMTLDVDGCTFWYTNEYYKEDGRNYQTHIGSFSLPSCTPVGQGTLQGTVRSAATLLPIAGATVALGSRTATTDASGAYSFSNLPAGTYPSISASNAGFNTASATSIVVNELATTVRDFSLTTAATAGCLTDTTFLDFNAGVASNCNLTDASGTVTLIAPETINQQNTTTINSGFGFNATNFAGQTFVPSATGKITRVDVNLFCSGCSGTPQNLTLSIRDTDPVTLLPTGPDLASATIPGFLSGVPSFKTAIFATPFTATAGTRYALVFRPIVNPTGLYAYVVSSANVYNNGSRVTSANSGATWTADLTRDLGFRVFMNTGFVPLGTYISSVKDANPAAGSTPTWGTISWNAFVPEGTSLTFHVGASDSFDGPFAFVGPDGTASTSFANGASLSQFNGKRYLKYSAALETTNSAVAPVINDVTICFEDQVVTSLSIDPATGTYGGMTTLTATLTGAGSGVANQTIAFTLNGNPVGIAITNGSGVASLPEVSLAGIDAGSYPGAVAASFTGGAGTGFTSSSATNSLTVNTAPLTVRADDKTKILNAPNPALTGAVNGLVNGDVITANYSTTALTASPVGSFPIVPEVVDAGSRLANYNLTVINGSLSITYATAGTCLGSAGHAVLSPLAPDSERKQGSTAPVKFRVCDVNGVSIGPSPVVSSFKLEQIVQGGVTSAVNQAPQSTNGDDAFRWDPADRQWVFNLSTKNLPAGATYGYRIALIDGSSIVFHIALR